MVDDFGLPTVFFTHSTADNQWPELARILSPDDPTSSSSRSRAVIENPAIADSHCIQSSWKLSTLKSWVPLITGTDLNGSIVVALTFMALHLMFSKSLRLIQAVWLTIEVQYLKDSSELLPRLSTPLTCTRSDMTESCIS